MDRRIGKGLLVAVALAAGSSASMGQTPGPRMSGATFIRPDVIVSTIGPSFTKYGTVGTITGYAVTTVSCNITTTTGHDAIWFDIAQMGNPLANQHPVIAQNVFRMKAGRFEQIGMSWLKHGWCAADAPQCGTPYAGNPSCDWLGRNATDTYGADLNAAQTDLGPRSEVNAWTGVYPYPYILAWQQTGNAIYKRLQMQNDDLNPALNPGSLYFGEVVYIATDEWPEQRFNNGSWRRCTVGSLQGGGYNMAFTGNTVPQQYGINAWKVNDPTVTLINVDNGHDGTAQGGDGRFIVGVKVTDNLDGTWDYEYAIYNANNHRGAQAFSIPLHCKADSSSFTFHDTPYHSGEPFNGTDWTQTTANGTVSWNTQTFAENPNANALRWCSLYNFHLRTNTPPTTKTATITLFKNGPVGSPTALTFNAPAPSDPVCLANWNHDKVTNSTDVGEFVNDWFLDQEANGTVTDINCDGLSNSTDVSDFVNLWFEAQISGCV